MPDNEIDRLKDRLVARLSPVSIYLFASYANGTYSDESDIDFYIVVNDDITDLSDTTSQAYKAIRALKSRSVDIIVSRNSRFEMRKIMPTI